MAAGRDHLSRRALFGLGATSLVAGIGSATLIPAQAAEARAPFPMPTTGDHQAPTWPEGPDHHLVTEAIHAGEDSGCSAYPIYQGTNNHNGVYTRGSNPTIDSVEVKIKKLEGAEFGIATACGMAAISSTLFSLLKPGKRIVHHRTLYGGTQELMGTLRDFGIEVQSIDMTEPDHLRTALNTKPAHVVYAEVHSNHLLEVIDVKACADLAHRAGATLVIDNTFLTPYLLQPLALGADIVLHSATKYMMGHGNGLAGIVCGRRPALEKVQHIRNVVGTILSPANAALLHQGIKTLPLRLERHCANAMTVAQFLSTHGKVDRVLYPGLPSHPQHQVAKRQVRAFGGMVGFEVKPGTGKVWEKLKRIKPWWSLGDAETLMANHFFAGLTPNSRYIRLSVGLEHPDDIIADLTQALDHS